MWQALIQPIVGLAKTWMDRKGEKAQAIHEREITQIRGEIDADIASTNDMRNSWKDEYLTILLTIPVMIVFYAALMGDAAMITQVKSAFEIMNGLPEWYQWALLGAVAASFGIRTFNKVGGK